MMELIAALIDLGAWNLIGLAGIVLIGLPHGALDGAVAMHLGIVQRFSDLAQVHACLYRAGSASCGNLDSGSEHQFNPIFDD